MSAEVTMLLGPAKSGKTRFLLERYQNHLNSGDWTPGDRRNLWIAPTHGAVGAVRDRLAATADRPILDPGVVTFSQFAEQLVSLSGEQIRPINVLQKRRILQNLLVQAMSEQRLKYFGPVAQTPGFLRQVEQLIAELKRRDIWADKFAERCRDQRDRDFAVIYRAYHQYLHDNALYDAEGRFWAARGILENAPAAKMNFGFVVVDGFSNFTVAQRDILMLLANRSDQLFVSLTNETRSESCEDAGRQLLFSRTQETLELLRSGFAVSGIHNLDSSEGLAGQLRHAAETVFADHSTEVNESTVWQTPGTIEILTTDSTASEVAEIARQVKQILLSRESLPEEVAVVFRTLPDVLPLVREVFDDFGIPWATNERQSLKTSPVVRTLLDLLSLHADDWPFDRLLSVVGNRLVAFSAPEADEEQPTKRSAWSPRSRRALERAIRRAQLPSGREQLCEQLSRWAAGDAVPDDDTDSDELQPPTPSDAQVACQAAKALAEALDELPQAGTIDEWIERLGQLVQAAGLLRQHNETDWNLLKSGLRSLAAVDQIADADSPNLPIGELIRLIHLAAETGVLPAEHDDVGRVQVLSAESARTIAVEHLFLAGLAEQSFSSAERVGRIYSDQEIDQFSDAAEVVSGAFSFDERRSGDMMFWFYELITRPRKSLTLSYPALDSRGQPLPASPFVVELERCFAPSGLPVKVVRQEAEETQPGELPLGRGDLRIRGVAEAVDGRPEWFAGALCHEQFKGSASSIVDGLICLAHRSKFEGFGPFEGVLSNPAVRNALAKRFNAEHLWSASRLETYAACPFQFFSERVLRLEPLADIALESDYLGRGSLLHEVLARVHLELAREQQESPDELPSEAELVERFNRALDEIVAANPRDGLAAALREIAVNEVAGWASQYAAQELEYRNLWKEHDVPIKPAHFEVRFGPDAPRAEGVAVDPLSTTLPFELDLGDEKILITGQIDRLDTGELGGVTVFSIIDYKSSRDPRFNPGKILKGLQLQLPLYALAAEKHLFSDRNAAVMAAGYWGIQKQGFKPGVTALNSLSDWSEGTMTSGEQWQSLVEGIIGRIGEMVASMRRGEFPVFNDDPNCTKSCDFSKICRIGQIRSLQKRWQGSEEREEQRD